MQKHVNLVDLVKSFPTNIFLQNLASIQKRTSPIKFAHLAEKSENGSISNLSTKRLTPRHSETRRYQRRRSLHRGAAASTMASATPTRKARCEPRAPRGRKTDSLQPVCRKILAQLRYVQENLPFSEYSVIVQQYVRSISQNSM